MLETCNDAASYSQDCTGRGRVLLEGLSVAGAVGGEERSVRAPGGRWRIEESGEWAEWLAGWGGCWWLFLFSGVVYTKVSVGRAAWI